MTSADIHQAWHFMFKPDMGLYCAPRFEDSGGGVGSASYVGLKMDFDSFRSNMHT